MKNIKNKLNPASDKYSPYSVGSTMDDEGLYFGVTKFDKDWLDNNRDILNSDDKTAKQYYSSVYEAEQQTLKAEQELAELNALIDDQLKYNSDPDMILSGIIDDYPTLKKT